MYASAGPHSNHVCSPPPHCTSSSLHFHLPQRALELCGWPTAVFMDAPHHIALLPSLVGVREERGRRIHAEIAKSSTVICLSVGQFFGRACIDVEHRERDDGKVNRHIGHCLSCTDTFSTFSEHPLSLFHVCLSFFLSYLCYSISHSPPLLLKSPSLAPCHDQTEERQRKRKEDEMLVGLMEGEGERVWGV